MKFSIDPNSMFSSLSQASDASAQAAQQMREQFRSSLQDINKLTAATVRDQTQQWNGVFSGMNRGFSQTITSMSSSSRTLQQNIARVLDQILADFLRMLERMVAQWVAQHTFMQIFGIGSHKATTAANIGSSAAEGGAAAYASAAAIPVVGWSIAPAVAAEAYRAGVPWLRIHDLRHTAITRMAEAGVPIPVILSMAGHISTRMQQHYTSVIEFAKRRAVEAAFSGGNYMVSGGRLLGDDPRPRCVAPRRKAAARGHRSPLETPRIPADTFDSRE